MKKFLLLLKKEIKELLTPQLIVPFLAVMVVFFFIGNVASKQVKKQADAKESIAIYDQDSSATSAASLQVIGTIVTVEKINARDSDDFLSQMKEKKMTVGIIFPKGFEKSLTSERKSTLKSYSIIDNFSVLASKRYAILDAATKAVNEFVSNNLINSSTGSTDAAALKNPIANESFVASRNNLRPGNPIQLLGYISQQTNFVPVVLFVVIIMAAQMIASAVATEKENKTLETLLSLPISRKTIAGAKMIAAGLVSLIMAAIYMLGMRSFTNGVGGNFAQPSTGGASAAEVAQSLGLNFSTAGYLELGAILFLGILFALAISMILGAFSEDAKSAQGVVAPLMILVLIPYFVTLLLDINTLSAPVRYLIYAIPFSHIFLASPNILLGNHLFILYGALYLLVLFLVSVIIAGRIFSSDLILTMKLNFGKKKRF